MRCAEFICGMALSFALCSCGSQSTLAQVLPLVKLVVRAVAHSVWVPHRLTRTTKIVRGSAMAKRKAWWRCAERYVGGGYGVSVPFILCTYERRGLLAVLWRQAP